MEEQALDRLARLGAQIRLAQLVTEKDAILAAFPGPGKPKNGGDGPVQPAKRRRRPKWSAKARKAAAERMKRYWAAKRAGKVAATRR